MFDGLFILIVLCIVMTIASLLAGALPLSFALSPSQIRLISTVGVGVLVGTSLVVIIPEGVETLYSAGRAHEPHSRRPPISTPLPQAGTPLLVRGIDSNSIYGRAEELNVPGLNDLSALPGPVIPATIPDSSSAGSSAADSVEVPATKFSEDQNPSQVLPELGEGKTVPERSPHAYIGISLLLGFVLMYLIDKIPQHAANGVQGPRRPHHISLANLAQGLSGGTATGSFDDHEAHVASPRPARTLSTTIGLVIHAAADGIALGASTSSSNMNLGFMVFLAIMFHKAPAAFGLTSVLLKQGMGKRRARSHLLIFSLAAPVGALTTWSFVNVAGRGRIGADEETQWWTGILLLFSAGTFLYVAMHTMQEEQAPATSLSSHDFSSSSNGYANGSMGGNGVGGRYGSSKEGPRLRDTLAAVGGMLIPLLTQVGGHHH